MKHLSFFLLASILFPTIFFSSSCSQSNTELVQSTSFFDLKQFFSEELQNIERIREVKKTVEVNGEPETIYLNSIDLIDEITTFSNSDINRVAWKDKYSVDSVFEKTGLLKFLRYKAISKDMRTQLLEVCYRGDKVNNVFFINVIDGFATNSQKEINYTPGSGYSILTNQETLLGSRKTFKVEVGFNY